MASKKKKKEVNLTPRFKMGDKAVLFDLEDVRCILDGQEDKEDMIRCAEEIIINAITIDADDGVYYNNDDYYHECNLHRSKAELYDRFDVDAHKILSDEIKTLTKTVKEKRAFRDQKIKDFENKIRANINKRVKNYRDKLDKEIHELNSDLKDRKNQLEEFKSNLLVKAIAGVK